MDEQAPVAPAAPVSDSSSSADSSASSSPVSSSAPSGKITDELAYFNEDLVGGDQDKATKAEQLIAEENKKDQADVKAEEPLKEEPKADAAKADAAKADAAKAEAADETPRIKALRQMIDADPDAKAALDKNDRLRNMTFANARHSGELATYKQVYATLELARAGREQAEALGTIERQWAANTSEGHQATLDRMWENSIERDAQGNPVKDANGNTVSTGRYEGFVKHYREQHFWPGLKQLIDAPEGAPILESHGLTGEDAKTAIDVLSRLLGDKQDEQPQVSRTAADPYADLPPDVKAKLAKFDALERQQGDQQEQAKQQYQSEVTKHATDSVMKMLLDRVEKIAGPLNDAMKKRIADDAYAELNVLAKKDTLYTRQIVSLRDAAKGDDGKESVAQKVVEYARNISGPVLRKLADEYKGPAIQANEETRTKIETQQKRNEPSSSGGATTPSRQDDAAMVAEMLKLKKQLGLGNRVTTEETFGMDTYLPKLRKLAAGR